MKTSKEFFLRLQSDEAFAAEVSKKAKEKIDAGQNDYKEIWIPLAAEYDYELTGKELDDMYAKASEELSDEELGKVSGGITPLLAITSVILVGGGAVGSLFITLNKASILESDPDAPGGPTGGGIC